MRRRARSKSFRPLRILSLFLPLAFCVSCGFFVRQPALPRRAAIEGASDDKFAVLIEKADIIYFPSELVGAPVESERAWRLIEALANDGRHFVLGWDIVGGDDQPLLDQWSRPSAAADPAISRLHLHADAREVESRRAFLRETHKRGAHLLALRCPSGLTGEEEFLRGFSPPPGDFEKFLRRSPAGSAPNDGTLRAEYNSALLAEEFAAQRLAEYFREHRDGKLLVFLHRRLLGDDRGVPYFVAQRVKARQLVLDSHSRPSERARLMADERRGLLAGRGFQIVDRAPTSGSDQL